MPLEPQQPSEPQFNLPAPAAALPTIVVVEEIPMTEIKKPEVIEETIQAAEELPVAEEIQAAAVEETTAPAPAEEEEVAHRTAEGGRTARGQKTHDRGRKEIKLRRSRASHAQNGRSFVFL